MGEHRNFEGAFVAHEQWKYCTAINCILVWLRCFEHLRAFPFMGYIVKVLASAVSPILVVCISFAVVSYAFALAYVLAFSGGVHGYRTIEYRFAKVILFACILSARTRASCCLCFVLPEREEFRTRGTPRVLKLDRPSGLMQHICSWTITTMTRQLRGLDDFDELWEENRLLGERTYSQRMHGVVLRIANQTRDQARETLSTYQRDGGGVAVCA